MSQVETLKKHIDSLCEELGIQTAPYKSNSTVKELQKNIDDLEAQLPEEDDSDDETDVSADNEAADAGDDDIASGTEISAVSESDLPDDAVVEDKGVEVSANSSGDIEIKAHKYTIELVSHGERVKIVKGKSAFVEEKVAVKVVDDGHASFLSK